MTAPPLVLAAHTLSGVMPGDPAVVRHPLAARLAAAAGAGFAGLCLHLREYALLRDAGWQDAALRAAVEGAGLFVPAIEFLGDWHHATPQAQSARDLAFAAARAFGAPVVNVGLDALGDAGSLEALVDPLRDLCLRADDQGLKVALEFVAWGQGERLEQALDLVARAGGQAGLLVDLWHLAWRGIGPGALAMIPPAMVLGLQVSDSIPPDARPVAGVRAETMNRRLCGDGSLPIAAYLAKAAACGWQAPVAVEVIAPDFAATDVVKGARRAYETTSPFVTTAWS